MIFQYKASDIPVIKLVIFQYKASDIPVIKLVFVLSRLVYNVKLRLKNLKQHFLGKLFAWFRAAITTSLIYWSSIYAL